MRCSHVAQNCMAISEIVTALARHMVTPNEQDMCDLKFRQMLEKVILELYADIYRRDCASSSVWVAIQITLVVSAQEDARTAMLHD